MIVFKKTAKGGERMSLIIDCRPAPWSQLEGKEIKQEVKKAKAKGDKKTVKILEEIDRIGQMAEAGMK